MASYANSDVGQLLGQARHGKQLGELLELYRGYLKVLARLQMGDRLPGKVDASDVVQEVFLQAHRTFPQFRGTTEQELLVWLRTMLSGVLSNFLRQFYGTQQRNLRLEREMDRQLNRSSLAIQRLFVDDQTSPSEKAVRKEHAVILADALEQLPKDYREVIILRHLEELGFPEVAQRMHRSVDSVKNLWARALSRLRQLTKDVA